MKSPALPKILGCSVAGNSWPVINFTFTNSATDRNYFALRGFHEFGLYLGKG